MNEDQTRAGARVRREVLGDAYVDKSEAGRTPFNAEFQDMLTTYAWGGVWTRPGLDRRTRSCVTVAMLIALGRDDELALHIRGALNNGVTPEEIKEVLLQAAIYSGIPAANAAFRIAGRVLAETDANQ